MPEESNDSIDSTTANKENLTTNTNGTSDPEDSRASLLSTCEDTNDSVAISEPVSEVASEGPSESCDIPSTSPSPSHPSPTDEVGEDEPAPKKMKVDE